VQRICPELPIHASTQMSLTSGESIRVAEKLGIRRVVLARELSIAQIAEIRRQTELELEVFIHGALCIGYSGQCLTSLSLGGRSANRGQCAQACRMPYDLIRDGKAVDLGGARYLLSPQDLAAYDLVPQLIEAGVSGMKIEGRLKSAEYVANVTRQYRLAIDATMAGRPLPATPQQWEELGLSFSRGFCHGWLEGADPKTLVPGESSDNRGIYLGQVTAVRPGRVEVELAASIKRGDGIVFEQRASQTEEQGCRVYEVFQQGRSLEEPIAQGHVELTFGRDALDLSRVQPGQRVWKTDDPELMRRLRKSYEGDQARRRVALDLVVEATVGRCLRIRGQAASGAVCLVVSPDPLAEAQKHPLTLSVLREQLGRLGGTIYELRHLEAKIDGQPMIPLSVLGKLRHGMVEQLDASLAQPPARMVVDEPVLSGEPSRPGEEESPDADRVATEAQLFVLCRSRAQLEAALGGSVAGVIADLRNPREYAEVVALARAAGKTILLATPRIQKPGELELLSVLLDQPADGVLVRNLAGLAVFRDQGMSVVADFSLNTANPWSAEWLLGQGATRVTASYDLNRQRLAELAAAMPPGRLEVVLHQHMPMFHMEYCLFCALLSPGNDRTNCGQPCREHEVRLRDRMGKEHWLAADAGCRNTLFNATPQSVAEAVPTLLKQGVRHFRIELLEDAKAEELGTLVEIYSQLLAGRLSVKDAWERLRATDPSGVSRGMLDGT
jgi:U32 family peptidase